MSNLNRTGGSVEPGVEYPRQLPTSEFPDLPSGWTAVEYAYKSGNQLGKTYIRFNSAYKKDTLCTIRKVIEKDAQYRGLSDSEVKRAVEQFEQIKAQQKEYLKREREEAGFVKGEKREEAINAFQAKYGKLDGATVANLDGWRAESIYRETCGQTAVTYYNDQNKPFCTVKDVEAFLGVRIMQGRDIPSIEQARSRVTKDESGKVVNTARHEGVVTKTAQESAAQSQNKRRKVFVTSSMYTDAAIVTVPVPGNKNDKHAHGLAKNKISCLRKSANDMLSLLRARHFQENTDLFALQFQKEPTSTSHAAQLQGLYYKGPEKFNNRAYYQQVRTKCAGQLCCTNLYIFWSLVRQHWKVSASLDDSKAGLAIADGKDGQDSPSPELSWQILSLLLKSRE
eukprot:TRINITY_DN42216_c0_g1_i1.p1 TRINITY_DN42216_c0_g1~~TRINITY_DN42216_c0_g1_i1.p1  ORF type:complete len:396 (-),score=52.66 TRINITY_DN42216_c0_g1_i1:10-1197(-)